MLGINPFDRVDPFGRRQHAYSQPSLRTPRPSSRPAPVPRIHTDSTADAYTILVQAPRDYELDEPRGSLVGSHEMELSGVLQPVSQLWEYATAGRAGVYAAPGRQMIGVVPGSTLVRGSPPTRGWVELEDEGWVHGEDLQLVSRPPSPRRFERSLDMPSDALMQRATSRVLEDGALRITVPRRLRAAQPAPTPRSAPATKRPAPPRSAPAKAPAPARAATPQPAAAAAPTAAPKPAAAPNPSKPATAKPLAHHSLLPSSDGPVLMEVEASGSNVQAPEETVQFWSANPDGGFARQAYAECA